MERQMNESLSYVAAHKGDYQEILNLLKTKEKNIPGLSSAIEQIEMMIRKCDFYEKWGFDLNHYNDSLPYEIHAVFVHSIHNLTKAAGKIVDEELLYICHSAGPFIFSCTGLYGDEYTDYPKEFFDKFYEEVKTACPPDYEDRLNRSLYYKRERAKVAYEFYVVIRKKYMELNEKRIKRLHKERLEKA